MSKMLASVTLHVEVYSPRALWERALKVYSESSSERDSEAVRDEFIEMCGPADEPDVAECLRMVLDPGDSPPGVHIQDSHAELVPLSLVDAMDASNPV